MFLKTLALGLTIFSLSTQAAEKKGVASLSTQGGIAFAIDLGGNVPTNQWQIEAKVTKILKNGFEFDSEWFEAADSSAPDLTIKKGTFLIRLPDKEVVNLAVDQQVTIVFNPALKECQEQGIAILRDDRLILGAYRRYQEVFIGITLGLDQMNAMKQVKFVPQEAKKEKLVSTETQTTYLLPVEVTSLFDKASATIAAADVDKKANTIKVDGKDHGIYIQQSRLTEVAKDAEPLKCKPYVLETAIWLK